MKLRKRKRKKGAKKKDNRGRPRFLGWIIEVLGKSITEESTMPGRPRLILPGIPLHIIQRGNNRQAYFYVMKVMKGVGVI